MFSTALPWTLVSGGYESVTMDFLSQYAAAALSRVQVRADMRVADVACGPGTVARLLHNRVRRVDAWDFSEGMIGLLSDHLQRNGITNVYANRGDGQDLPCEAAVVDLAVSMFGLMFFPDRPRGFAELHRILKPGGCAVVSSWCPVEESPLMSLMFGAMRAAKPDLPRADTTIENLEKKEVFEREMAGAGFHPVSVTRMTQTMTASSTVDFWNRMTLGSAPIVMLRQKVSTAEWQGIETRAKEYIDQQIPHYPVTLGSDAWIGVGFK